MTKRSRDDNNDWFSKLKAWIVEQGGWIHPSIAERDRDLYASAPLDGVVLRIPSSVLVQVTDSAESSSTDTTTATSNLYHSPVDCALATIVAQRPASHQAYWDSLPSDPISLPRTWTDRSCLQSSPLLRRITEQHEGLQNDYDRLFSNKDTVSLEDFSQSMAVVSSRAFELPSATLVPFLDLCNHTRRDKNLTYARNDNDNVLVVTTVRPIPKHETLSITYGALGNGQLLLNYGFCLPHNVEPDGSCNDVYDFWYNDEMVGLRRGPKAYSYGGLVKALELFFEEHDNDVNEEDDEDDMEAFLNDDDTGLDLMEPQQVDGGDEAPSDSHDEERQALAGFRARLVELQASYDEDQVREGLALQDGSPTYYSSILLDSELATIRFYIRAVDRVQAKLQDKAVVAVIDPNADTETQQIEELADAFMKIRHSGLF